MASVQFDKDGTLKGKIVLNNPEAPMKTVAIIAACAILGFLIPLCGVLIFTNWLDPLFR